MGRSAAYELQIVDWRLPISSSKHSAIACNLKSAIGNRKLVSDALRPAFPLLLALGHDRGTEPAAEVFGKFVELRVAVDLDGLLGCVANHVAVVAPRKMIFQIQSISLVAISACHIFVFDIFTSGTTGLAITGLAPLEVARQPLAQLQACPQQARFYRRNAQFERRCCFFR